MMKNLDPFNLKAYLFSLSMIRLITTVLAVVLFCSTVYSFAFGEYVGTAVFGAFFFWFCYLSGELSNEERMNAAVLGHQEALRLASERYQSDPTPHNREVLITVLTALRRDLEGMD